MADAKACTKCREELPLGQFSPDRKSADGRRSRCRDCRSEDGRQERADNPEPSREAARRWRQNNPEAAEQQVARWRAANPGRYEAAVRRRRKAARTAVFDHYGRVCACCGNTESLTIDHVGGDGAEHRAGEGLRTGTDTYLWLVKNGFPDGFQTLCLPCNSSKKNGQSCQLNHQAAA